MYNCVLFALPHPLAEAIYRNMVAGLVKQNLFAYYECSIMCMRFRLVPTYSNMYTYPCI